MVITWEASPCSSSSSSPPNARLNLSILFTFLTKSENKIQQEGIRLIS